MSSLRTRPKHGQTHYIYVKAPKPKPSHHGWARDRREYSPRMSVPVVPTPLFSTARALGRSVKALLRVLARQSQLEAFDMASLSPASMGRQSSGDIGRFIMCLWRRNASQVSSLCRRQTGAALRLIFFAILQLRTLALSRVSVCFGASFFGTIDMSFVINAGPYLQPPRSKQD